jgi:type IV secretion system protein VirB9
MNGGTRSAVSGFCCAAVLGLHSLLHSLGAAAETEPVKGVIDGRVRTASYNGDEVYRLRGVVGYQIDLEFEAGETFVGVAAGDIEGLSFLAQDNHLFLKPKASGVVTNLTVLTSRRHYQFDYSAVSRGPSAGAQEAIFALRFTYPPTQGAAGAAAAAARLDAQLGGASANRLQNRDYWYCGAATLRPTFASDDGVQTRLRFAANSDQPAIFVRNEDDSESLLNFHMEGGDVIVHRVARRFILRRGKLTGCIVNQGFDGGGARLDSGTVAPEVDRRVQGGAR